MFTDNLILAVDSYKSSHAWGYPPRTQHVYSYIESRGGKWDATVFFGIQAFVQQYLSKPVTVENVEEAEQLFQAHGEPFNRKGWDHIVHVHGGKLPIRLSTVPEGNLIGTHNVLATIVNTDPACWWLPSYLETALLRAVWYGSTVATNSFDCKVAILRALNQSSDDPLGQIDFKLHDFGARGVSSGESAALGGLAHLVNFKGTDTVEALVAARRFYGESMAGFSIPAAEHSTITAWGRDGEVDAYRNMIKQFAKPGSLVAVVSDSYDLMNAVGYLWGDKLKQEVLASGATIVVRPDSGDPLTVPVNVLRSLAASYGTTINSKGYHVLPPCIRVIQGDGITADSLPRLLENVLAAGFSADNIAFGMGGGLLQQVNRDTQKFAMKTSAVMVNDAWRDVCKDPATDPGKRSRQGRLALIRDENGHHETVSLAGNEAATLLVDVFGDGRLLTRSTLSEVRARAHVAAIRLANGSSL